MNRFNVRKTAVVILAVGVFGDLSALVGPMALADVAYGPGANGKSSGAAVGDNANGATNGAALGFNAKGFNNGAAVGRGANGSWNGAAGGKLANGVSYGAALGSYANSHYWGAALGNWANGADSGAAVGYLANAYFSGAAVGNQANAYYGGTAVGAGAVAAGSTRAAIGGGVHCTVDNRTKVIGNLEMTANDGTIYWNGGSKTFVIDHPLDPENKLLRHACLEGPVVQNVYNGIAQLDANGEARVALPAYFGALNADPRYILTPMGASMPNLFVKQEVQDNAFVIGGGAASGRVSWMIFGERNDPAARDNPLAVEEPKAVPGLLYPAAGR